MPTPSPLRIPWISRDWTLAPIHPSSTLFETHSPSYKVKCPINCIPSLKTASPPLPSPLELQAPSTTDPQGQLRKRTPISGLSSGTGPRTVTALEGDEVMRRVTRSMIIHSFHVYFLSTCFTPGTIADAGNTSETNHNKVLTDLELTCLCVCVCVCVCVSVCVCVCVCVCVYIYIIKPLET